MARYLVRAGGSVLAALTIVAGGAVMGAGTAVALPSWMDEIWQNVAPPCVAGQDNLGDARPYCYNTWFLKNEIVGDQKFYYQGRKVAAPGAEVQFHVGVRGMQAAYDDPAADVDVTSFTHHVPKGFELIGVRAVRQTPTDRGAPVDEKLEDFTTVVDPVSGDVTVMAPSGGWAIPPGYDHGRFESSSVSVTFTYRAPDEAFQGTTGMTATGTEVPTVRGWIMTEDIRSDTDNGGAGSTGS